MQASPSSLKETGRIRTLVISDQPLVLVELRKFIGVVSDIVLIGEGADSSAATLLAEKLQPNVLLLDGTASAGGSLATLAALKAASPQLPIVFLALQDSKTYIMQAFKAGAAGYIVSMAGEQHIANAIREVHAGHRYLCPRIRGLFPGFSHRPPLDGRPARGEDPGNGKPYRLDKGETA